MKNSIADAHYQAHVKARWKMVLATMAMALHAGAIVTMVWFLIKFDTYLLDTCVLVLNAYAFNTAYRWRCKQQEIALAALHRYNAYRHEVAM